MKDKKLTIGAAALTAVIVAVGFAASSFAYQGDPSVQGPNYTSERHEAMETAFEAGNYNAWKELMSGKGRVIQVVNENNFAQFAKAHALAENGDLEGAKEIRAELGLGQGMRKGGNGQKGGGGMHKSGAKGQNSGGNFIDANRDGICDNLQ
ncbi:MAG: hypothetical protein U9Q85_04180 [Patescibacteria group bacterium]|nr:hypothetical protein [Patescibacteria group bacterium]